MPLVENKRNINPNAGVHMAICIDAECIIVNERFYGIPCKRLPPSKQPCYVETYCLDMPDTQYYLFNLVVKGKPSIAKLDCAMADFRDECSRLDVAHVAIPRDCCALGSLEWRTFKNCINRAFFFDDLDIELFANMEPCYFG
jgi:hypothetical protein